ncbi:MAG: NrdH-redoxin [Candidatus Methanoliparum thermophilum]|uniref:NrdH-redoxin n=1 Tax=Methanoliparum thermophilum TaxID=2491083 RepID=A0A520KSH8_METT2|nr:glutaredoxin [Candidatus Methanoliparum sp. LAM-1]RZN64871.1 MAG: NrdH-redoxin [Candidatus Methanoliparum thermophilum]BDC36256.1 hypothetical protein MTLP_09380 [Candidatus Methanoliparum sp. LAM-1]
MVIKIFTLPNCPHCKILKDKIRSVGIPFKELDMEDPDCMTDLIMDGVYVKEGPVLFIDGRYYTHDQIFDKQNNLSQEISRIFDSWTKNL